MKGNDEVKQHSANSFEPRIIIVQLKERLIEMNYSKSTINRLDSVWRNFTQYWEEDHQLDFTLQTIQELQAIDTAVKWVIRIVHIMSCAP